MITMNFNDVHWWNKMGDLWAINKLKRLFLSALELWEARFTYKRQLKCFIYAASYLRADCGHVLMSVWWLLLTTTSRKTTFIEELRGTCAAGTLKSAAPIKWSFTASFIWLLLYEPITSRHQTPLHSHAEFFKSRSAFFFSLSTLNKMSSISWCPGSLLEICYYLHRRPEGRRTDAN